jgi:Multiubiquitin
LEELEQETESVTILVNGSPYAFDARRVNGLQIKTKASLAPNSELYKKEGEHLTPIGNDQTIEIHNREEFVDYPPTPVS